ncbi:MAG: hypothetical protein MJ166_08235 [Clostridia bacterium]|nr:hypothetical protein [Clostridia bacterium]
MGWLVGRFVGGSIGVFIGVHIRGPGLQYKYQYKFFADTIKSLYWKGI